MISILILTLNEELNLPECLDSVSFSDDIFVLDSLSTDSSVGISRARGAHVVQRRFDNWSAHQNWACSNLPFKHEWVFYLDADERVTPELRDELLSIAADNTTTHAAFYVGRKNFFMGRWIKHAMPPGMVMRFFKPPAVRFERVVNPIPVIEGSYGYLKHLLLHYNFSKGMAEWFVKHNKYSQFEAVEGVKILRNQRGGAASDLRCLFTRDKAARRKALKNLSFHVPCRAFLRFLHVLFLKFGFLDGRAGIQYAIIISIYEYWIGVKIVESRSDWRRKMSSK